MKPYTETQPCIEGELDQGWLNIESRNVIGNIYMFYLFILFLECVVVAEWSDWSECTKTCGGGLQSRHRECKYSNGFKEIERENRTCNDVPCFPECKHQIS